MLVHMLKRGEAAAVDLASEMFPDITYHDIRPKVSQISVSLKRLESKGVLTDRKAGRKRIFRLIN